MSFKDVVFCCICLSVPDTAVDHLHGVYVTRVICPACIDLQYSFVRTIEGWVTLVAGVHRSSVHYWLLWEIRAGI
jgi:hypothetical protein